jgi:hypothetical protein
VAWEGETEGTRGAVLDFDLDFAVTRSLYIGLSSFLSFWGFSFLDGVS